MSKLTEEVENIFENYEFCIHCGDKCESDSACHKQEKLDTIKEEILNKIKEV